MLSIRSIKLENECHEGHKKIVSSVIASMVNDIECKVEGCQICSDMENSMVNDIECKVEGCQICSDMEIQWLMILSCKVEGCQICRDMEIQWLMILSVKLKVSDMQWYGIHFRNADIARSEYKNDANLYKPDKVKLWLQLRYKR